MRDLAILTDGDACVPARLLSDLQITTAPLHPEPLRERERAGELRAAQAPLGTEVAAEACRHTLSDAAAVLYVGCGDGYGAAPEAINAARAAAAPEGGGGASAVVHDHASDAALMGCGWQAIAAAVAVRQGGDAAVAAAAAARVRDAVRVLAMLEYPAVAGVSGGLPSQLLHARAITRLSGSQIEVLSRPVQRDSALLDLRTRFAEEAGSGDGLLRVAVHHADAAPAAAAMARWVEQALGPEEVVIAPLTRHATTRLGPGMLGFAWYRDADGH